MQPYDLYDTKTRKHITLNRGGTNCCGLEELDFQALNPDIWEKYADDDTVWEELIAKYVRASCEVADERIVVVGIPVNVGDASMYNMEFYKKLLQTLRDFGFRDLCKPYKNKNSGNTITVLAGQMPG